MARRFSWDILFLIAVSSTCATAMGGLATGIFGFDPIGVFALLAASALGSLLIYMITNRSCTRFGDALIDEIERIIEDDARITNIDSSRFHDLQDQIHAMHARCS